MPEFAIASPQLSAEMRAKLRLVECSARIEPVDSLEALGQAEQVLMASVKEAAGPPLMTDGQPTVARVVAWMVHEGVNRNGQGFLKDELQVAAQKIGLPDYPLVMDFNHAAIRRPEGGQLMCGVWHSAEFAFDPKALEGQGAWGILVHGVLFSWLFPDVATALLAEQARNGSVSCSMACVAGSIEFATDANGKRYELLHNPVFFTNAVLDVPPADKDALGQMEEGNNEPLVEEKLMQQLCQADVFKARVQELIAAALARVTEEELHMPNEKPTLSIAQAEPTAEGMVVVTAQMTNIDGMVEAVSLEVQPVVAPQPRKIDVELAEVEAKLVEAQASNTALIAERDALAAKLADAESALEAAKAANEELVRQADVTMTEMDILKKRVFAIEQAEAEAAAKAKLETRLAELPEGFRTKHTAKDEAARAELEAKWAAKSDEEWQEFVAMLTDASGAAAPINTASYRARSIMEGLLPVPPRNESGTTDISARIHKILNS